MTLNHPKTILFLGAQSFLNMTVIFDLIVIW